MWGLVLALWGILVLSVQGQVSFPFSLQLGHRHIEVTLREGETVRDASARIARAYNLEGDDRTKFNNALIERLQELSLIPLANINIFNTPVQIFQNSDIDAIVNVLIRDSPKFVADMKVNDFEVSMIVSKVEDQLELAGVTEDRRPYPCGLVGMPDRRAGLFRSFQKVKLLLYKSQMDLWKEPLEAVGAALVDHALSRGRHIIVEKVYEVDPLDELSLYILFPYVYPRAYPRFYIALQMEQLPYITFYSAPYMRRMRAALEVWEYSAVNFPVLHKHHIRHIRHVPAPVLLSADHYKEIPPESEFVRTYGVNFFGTISERRRDILQSVVDFLRPRNITYSINGGGKQNGVWGDERYDTLISLNLHNKDEGILELHRIIPLVANGVWVISERGADSWYDSEFEKIVDLVDPDQFANRIMEVLSLSRAVFVKELQRRRDLLFQQWNTLDRLRQSGGLDFVLSRLAYSTAPINNTSRQKWEWPSFDQVPATYLGEATPTRASGGESDSGGESAPGAASVSVGSVKFQDAKTAGGVPMSRQRIEL